MSRELLNSVDWHESEISLSEIDSLVIKGSILAFSGSRVKRIKTRVKVPRQKIVESKNAQKTKIKENSKNKT